MQGTNSFGLAIMRAKSFFKALVVCCGMTFGIAYVLFSYVQTIRFQHNASEQLVSKTKEEVTRSLNHLQQYLNLTESRLLNSLDNERAISDILSLRVDPLLNDSHFPEIISMTFIPKVAPHLTYSKYGKTVLEKAVSENVETGISHLENGVFKAYKILYDENKKPFGFLHVTFSLENILYNHFSKNEVSIIAEKQVDVKDNPFAFKLSNLPYVFAINKAPLSFKVFLFEYKWQIFSAMSFGMALLLIGITGGAFLNRRRMANYQKENQKLKVKIKTLQKENADFSSQFLISQNLHKLKDQARTETTLFSHMLHGRYRQMMTQVKSINIVMSKLISEDAGQDKLLREIGTISRESISILDKLIRGYPAKESDEAIDVLKSIETIRNIFLPEIVEKNITFEVNGQIKKAPFIDRLTFEIVLHNIFHLVMGRLNKHNSFEIDLKESESLEITFSDDGYDIEAKLHQVKNHQERVDIFRLTKQNLKDFIAYLGWEIEFQSPENAFNTIKFTIPRAFQSGSFSDNVINLFGVHTPKS